MLSQQDYVELRREGYSDNEIQLAMGKVQQAQPQRTMQQTAMPQQSSVQNSAFQYAPNDNLVKWQLDLNDLLERAEHILKEDEVEVRGSNVIWIKNTKPTERLFNDAGVNEIMRILAMYVNRNTILSDYDPQEIKDKVFDFGKELNDLFFMKYEEMFNFPTFDECKVILIERISKKRQNLKDIYKDILGSELKTEVLQQIDSAELVYDKIMNRIKIIEEELMLSRRKNYPMIHRQLTDVIHSAFNRAKWGGERNNIKTARQIQQTEQIVPPNINIATGEQRKERGILNPSRMFFGKYK